MRTFRVTLSYDGTAFHGWQVQPGFRNVQEVVEDALFALTQERIRVMASGRTDTGVHAVGQVLSFRSETRLAPAVLVRALNAHLPEDVLVRAAQEVGESFDANRDAVRKLYRYVLHDGPVPSLFFRRYCHHLRHRLDDQAMSRSAECLVGTHDFRCFETDWPNRASSVRTITHLSVQRLAHAIPLLECPSQSPANPDWVVLDVEADGFLYNMVRAIAGTLINVGRGYWPETEVQAILEAGDRTRAGPTAPACGLFLMHVTYET